jgi:hypothetical protein
MPEHHKDLGFVLLNIDNSPIYEHIFNVVSEFYKRNTYSQTIIFSSNCLKTDTKNIPILHLSHAKFFNGSLVLFDIPSLLITQSFTNVYKKLFYASNIPWVNNSSGRYSEWYSIFTDQNLDIIAGNRDIYNIYEICWKKPISISENFNYESLQSII